MTTSIETVKERIVDRYWNNDTDADYSARNVFSSSLVRIPVNKVDIDIVVQAKDGNFADLDITDIVQEHKVEIDKRFNQAISDFSGFFSQYSGKESVISMCLFGPGSLDNQLSAKLDNMRCWYAREQSSCWSSMHGATVGHADIYTGWEALKWFLSGVVVTGVLWDLTKKAISDLFYKAKEMAYSSGSNDGSELYQRISLLDLSPEEIEKLSGHWFSNFQQFILNLTAEEQRFIHRLTNETASDSRTDEVSNILHRKGYICTIERNPGEETIVLFPEWIRFFQTRHNKEKSTNARTSRG